MENRYDNILREYNDQILALVAGNQVLREVMAYELTKITIPTPRIIELGCGEGHSSLPLLKHTNFDPELLDVSQKMIDLCKVKLAEFASRITYICKDAYEYLIDSRPYGVIVTEMTLHNFRRIERNKLLSIIFEKLNNGGSFLLMDKVYEDADKSQALDEVLKRFAYLPPKIAEAIIEHEKQDFTDEYRIDESPFLEELRSIGFTNVSIIDRVECNVVIGATK